MAKHLKCKICSATGQMRHVGITLDDDGQRGYEYHCYECYYISKYTYEEFHEESKPAEFSVICSCGNSIISFSAKQDTVLTVKARSSVKFTCGDCDANWTIKGGL